MSLPLGHMVHREGPNWPATAADWGYTGKLPARPQSSVSWGTFSYYLLFQNLADLFIKSDFE